jgi:hypothetical protein
MDADEGDDSKIRRNLVVFSTLVVSVAWLELPVAQIASGFFKLDKPLQVSPLKLWITCFLVLLYLTLRYRYTKEFQKFASNYNHNVQQHMNKLANKRTIQALALFLKTKRDDGGFQGELAKFYRTRVAKNHERFGGKLGEPSVFFSPDVHGSNMSGGKVSVSLYWKRDEGLQPITELEALPFVFQHWDYKFLRFRCHAKTMVNSHPSGQYIIPLLLAATAFTVVIWNLYHSL